MDKTTSPQVELAPNGLESVEQRANNPRAVKPFSVAPCGDKNRRKRYPGFAVFRLSW
jgi:hypothetical protein